MVVFVRNQSHTEDGAEYIESIAMVMEWVRWWNGDYWIFVGQNSHLLIAFSNEKRYENKQRRDEDEPEKNNNNKINWPSKFSPLVDLIVFGVR